LSKSTYCQTTFENGEILLTNGEKLNTKLLYNSLLELQKGIKGKINGKDYFFKKEEIKRIQIGKDYIFERLTLNNKDQIVELLNEGAIKLYLTYNDWMYISKENEDPIRLEVHVVNIDDQKRSIDTLNKTSYTTLGTFNYHKKYLGDIELRLKGSPIKVNNKMDLNVKNVKNIVAKYNATRPEIPSRKNFKSGVKISLLAGYGTATFFKEKYKYSGFDYYVEVQNKQFEKNISIFASYRPYITRDNMKFIHATAGLKLYVYRNQFFSPYISLGTQIYEFQTPKVIVGTGIKILTLKNTMVVFDVYSLPFNNYRFGIERSFSL
jgi:hypothetical protein